MNPDEEEPKHEGEAAPETRAEDAAAPAPQPDIAEAAQAEAPAVRKPYGQVGAWIAGM